MCIYLSSSEWNSSTGGRPEVIVIEAVAHHIF